ncbi:MAG: hypothetical protein NVSMB68_15700 [Thermoanaerobaculia bacterium]
MKKLSLFVLVVLCAFASAPLLAQENYTEGTLTRIILIRITPGHAPDFWNDVRQNLKPIYEEFKKQGVISDYEFFTKATTENADDWNVGIGLTFKNYAALDGLLARMDPITLKMYGSREARTEALKRRPEFGTTVSSFLIRNVDPRPMAAAPPR